MKKLILGLKKFNQDEKFLTRLFIVTIILSIVGFFAPGSELQDELFHQFCLPILLTMFTSVFFYFLTSYYPKYLIQIKECNNIYRTIHPTFKNVDYKIRNIRKTMIELSKDDSGHFKNCLSEYNETYSYNDDKMFEFDKEVLYLYKHLCIDEKWGERGKYIDNFRIGNYRVKYEVVKKCYTEEVKSEIEQLHQKVNMVLNNSLYLINGSLEIEMFDSLQIVNNKLNSFLTISEDVMPSVNDMKNLYESMNVIEKYLKKLSEDYGISENV